VESALACAGFASADNRVALVIGNSAYQHAAYLANPVNDAQAVADLLSANGYTVDLRRDLDIRELRRAVGLFAERVRAADKAVVFYAGHGIEVDGVNYLIPVDAKLERDFDVEDETISLDRVLRSIEPVRRLRLVILDACRDNPFTRTMKRTVASRSIGRGLAKVEPTVADTLVAFATEAGLVAADGDTPNSPFTSALVKHIATPGLDLRMAFGRVRDDVMRDTDNRQRPFVYGSLGGSTVAIVDAATSPMAAAPPPANVADPCAAAETHWKSAEAIGTIAVLEDHRKRFPNCPFAVLAKARIEALQAQNAPTETQQANLGAKSDSRQGIGGPFVPVPVSPLKQEATTLVYRLQRFSSGPLDDMLDHLKELYDANVDYYGRSNTHAQVLADKMKYFSRWPERTYTLVADSLNVSCDEGRKECTANGVVKFSVANPQAGRHVEGTATFTYLIVRTPLGPRVRAESGSVISRRSSHN
jgi:hypothetical protein